MAAPPKVLIITKKAKGHAYHGGAWKVAYADFVTAMMALFIMLWILSQTDKETKAVLSQYFRSGVFSGAPSAMQGGSGLLDKGYLDTTSDAAKELELETLDATAQRVDKMLRAQAASNEQLAKLMKDVSIKVTPEGLLIEIVDTKGSMLFDVSSAELKPPLIELLKVLGPMLARLQNKIQIHGHTDSRKFPPGSPNTNWSLSFERGDRARSILEPLLNPQQIMGVYAHGDSLPSDPDPMSPSNRRLAILAVNSDRGHAPGKPRGVTAPGASGVIAPGASGVVAPAPSGAAAPGPSGVLIPRPSGVAAPGPSGVVLPRPSGVVTPAPSP
jgi:chemotaxis protein MotB